MGRRVISASMFFPRGGSAHVLRSLATRLPDEGWDVTVLSGTRRDAGGHGDARRFYRGLDAREVDFTAALAADDPPDPPRGAPPMQPSYADPRAAPPPDGAADRSGIGPARGTVVGNGDDPGLFGGATAPADRAATWRRTLVEAPRGWRPGGDEGGVSYRADEVAPLAGAPVLVYV